MLSCANTLPKIPELEATGPGWNSKLALARGEVKLVAFEITSMAIRGVELGAAVNRLRGSAANRMGGRCLAVGNTVQQPRQICALFDPPSEHWRFPCSTKTQFDRPRTTLGVRVGGVEVGGGNKNVSY